MREDHLFTSESVTEGHPDKIADQISDAILDAALEQDKDSRVACETLLTTGMAFIAGEITTEAYVDFPKVVRNVIKDIGYTSPLYGFDYETCAVISSIDEQSPDIAMGVDKEGAGDQGMMFGYASNETDELMPMPILLAHKLTQQLAKMRKDNILNWLRPDGKSQVTVEYIDGKPQRISAVVISTQHDAEVSNREIKENIIEKVILPIIPKYMITDEIDYYINPTGRFVIGGPVADAGLTGRKIIVDTYGGVGSHGGGCFSGKDPSKVDRSASYMSRYIAKNIVASGLAEKAEVQLAYAIGIPEPVSVMINTYETGEIADVEMTDVVRKVFPLTPHGIIEHLDLKRPIYRKTAAYGHFGRNEPEFTWEKTDMVDALKKAVK